MGKADFGLIRKEKSLLCYWAVRNLGIGMAQIARRLN
jgi:hypothetical protein